MTTKETGQKTQKPSPSSSASAAATLKQPLSSSVRWGRRGRRHPFVRKQLRAHVDWTGWKWIRSENKELSKSVFSSGTIVELRVRRLFDWRPAMIIKEVENGKRFIVKLCDGKSEIVDSRIVRPKQPFFSVGEYELLDHVEVFDGSVWRDGVVRGIVYDGRYMVSFGKSKVASAQFNYSNLRPPMEWEDGIWHKRPKTRKGTPSDVICYSRKRKRGEVDHNSNLSSAVLSSDRIFTVVKKAAANVEDTQAKDTPIVLPFAKKSTIWKIYEAMEVFKKVPQNPHFSPLIKSTSEDFREGSALGLMASFSGLLEKLKDLETDVTVSQLGSLKESFTKLDMYGFDVTRPLSRINELLALKNRQVNILEKRKGLDKERMDESRRKTELEFSETERKMVEVKHKILELQRQEAALKEQKEAAKEQKEEAYRNVCQMESCARDLDVELEDVEFDFETMLSAPW